MAVQENQNPNTWIDGDGKCRHVPNIHSSLTQTMDGRRIYYYVMHRDGYACKVCEATEETTCLRIDHVRPRSRGGSHHPNNLQVLCEHCNCVKGGWIDYRFDKMVEVLSSRILQEHADVMPELLAALVTATLVKPSSVERWNLAASSR